ncbi:MULTISPECIES: 4'-phosphopantetheinyl transferase superfamily protein [unclassified Rhizobium]|uniref:4'-phosphopantetheinyl transferase family protein n=1 Tax=unclassified Rhizobium TaxID=2613769 RepID=UPI000EA9C4FC|nr:MULTISPECIES: 4'-phosphopantetheinyl transferase superfamily protein [unclassified Rhizobium]AYG69903.1 4'-phosphopantetheinyl transferase superfamily protein [Rhizobium sp. CCGE531]AYG76283.1 4'-phosphopantetheinyl transferase superfamily protein [Rhizobium sp. CCGE532]
MESIGPDVIDVWSWRLDAPPTDLGASTTLLSLDERARADRFIHDHHRLRFVAARSGMRLILGRYLGLPPQAIRFNYGDHGKPSVSAGGAASIRFNLSHSADLAVLAVSDRYELGVDIEEIRFLKEDVAKRFFSRREYGTLRSLPAECYLDGFYRCWTRKEAFIKAHGAGLSLPLDSFDVTFDWSSEPRLERLEGEPDAPENWIVLELATPINFAGAIVASTGGRRLRLCYRSECTAQMVSLASRM